MELAILNEKNLIEKYPGVNIQKLIKECVNYYQNNPFTEKEKRIYLQVIKDYLILQRLDFEEEIEDTKEKEEKNEDIEISQKDFTYLDENKKEKISIPKIVDYLLFNYDFKTIFGEKGEIIYFYEEGIWKKKGKEVIKTKTEELLNWKSSIRIISEVLEKIKRKTAIDYDEFQKIPLNLICLENGIFNLETEELLNFSSDYYFKSKIPVKYNKDSEIKEILCFIEETVYPEFIPVIQEFFGFCLFRRYFIKRALILFGEKNTGKTVLLNILNKFLGEKNVTGVSLQKIASKNTFALSGLKDKIANIYDDLSSEDLSDGGGFKLATGGGYISAEYKFGDPFQFMNFAKNIFATNKIPNVKEINDDAYYERWIPIPFDNQISKEEQDKFLFEKITIPGEMSGLLNWALEGLKRLLKNGKFSYDKTSEEVKVIMLRQNNPLVAFCDEVLIQEDGNKISKETMFKIYSKWCQDKQIPRLSKEQLGRNLAKHTNYLIAKGGNERVWENVKIEKYDIFDTF